MVPLPTVCRLHTRSTGWPCASWSRQSYLFTYRSTRARIGLDCREPPRHAIWIMSQERPHACYSSRDRWDEARSAYYKALQEGRIRRGWKLQDGPAGAPEESMHTYHSLMVSCLKQVSNPADNEKVLLQLFIALRLLGGGGASDDVVWKLVFSPLARSIPAKSPMTSVLEEAVETGDWRAAHYALYGMQRKDPDAVTQVHFRAAMKASCSEWRLVEPLLRDSLKTKWDKDIAANYALAIEAALNHGEVKPARRLYLEASLLNVVGRWSASFFTRSTHAFVKAGALEVALEIWSGVIMKHGLCGVEVSEVSDELLGACVKAGRWDEAFDLIDVLRSSQRPSRRTFTNLITPQNPEMILRLFQELIREDAKPQM